MQSDTDLEIDLDDLFEAFLEHRLSKPGGKACERYSWQHRPLFWIHQRTTQGSDGVVVFAQLRRRGEVDTANRDSHSSSKFDPYGSCVRVGIGVV